MAAHARDTFSWRRYPLLRTVEDFSSTLWWGRDAAAASMHVWTTEALPNSLTRLSSAIVSSAKDLYKCIIAHCADAIIKTHPQHDAALDLVSILCMHPDGVLNDEVFAQLIKHTSENPSPESERLAWGLLDILVRFGVIPSPAFEPYVMAYLEAAAASRRDVVGVLARLVRRRWQRQVLSTTDGMPFGRRWPPCMHRVPELKRGKLALHRVPAETIVLLPGGRSILDSGPPIRCFSTMKLPSQAELAVAGEPLPAGATLVIEPWETASAVISLLAAHVGMNCAAAHLALHVVNAAPVELLPRALVDNAAAGLAVPPAAGAAAAAPRFTLPAHYSSIVHAIDGGIVVGRSLRGDEHPCEALLAATAAGVPAVLMLRRSVWLPEPDAPLVMECAPFTQLSYHQLLASVVAGEQMIESADVAIDCALLAVAVQSALHTAGADAEVVTSAAALTALSTLHHDAVGAEPGISEAALREQGLLQLISPSWRAAMPDEEWLTRASQRAESLDNSPGLALTGEPLIALQRRFVSLLRSQPLCGATVCRVLENKAPPQLQPLPAPLFVAVDGSSFHLLTLEPSPFGSSGGSAADGLRVHASAAMDASNEIGKGDGVHAARLASGAGSAAHGGAGAAAVGGAGAAPALPVLHGAADSSSRALLRSGAMQWRILHSLPFRCLRRWGYSALGSFHMELLMELIDDQHGPVDDALRSGSVANLEFKCLEGQAIIARELESRLTATVKVRVSTADALGIDPMTWARPRDGPV